jgi:hypothetical protein
LEDIHPTVPELTLQVWWQPGPPLRQQFGSDPDQDPKWQSRTVANTSKVKKMTLITPSKDEFLFFLY